MGGAEKVRPLHRGIKNRIPALAIPENPANSEWIRRDFCVLILDLFEIRREKSENTGGFYGLSLYLTRVFMYNYANQKEKEGMNS